MMHTLFNRWRFQSHPFAPLSEVVRSTAQLAHSEQSGIVVAAVAMLDNRRTLHNRLQLPAGMHLQDEQLILHAYERWGDDCCEHLLGAYSFVIWDARSTRLFCARDHSGCMPFYYSLATEQFVFGTRIADVLSADGVPQTLDERYVRTRLANPQFADNERTFYKAVRKLPPGHMLSVWPDGREVKRYWFPERVPECRLPNDEAYVSAFIELLQTVIAEQLPTAQPLVGVHLSGGLDSSTITALAAETLSQRNGHLPLAYCWHPPPTTPSLSKEHRLIEQVQQHTSLPLRFQTITATDIQAALAYDLTLLPNAITLCHEQIVMRQAAADQVRVILSGWGGDEAITFDGRALYAELLRSGQWRRLWRESRAVSRRPFLHIIHQGVLLQYPSHREIEERIANRQLRLPRQHYLHPDFIRQVKPYPYQPIGYLNMRQTQLALFYNGHLAERIETWAEVGATHNILYRYPLLDKRIVEFAFALPPTMFRQGKWDRWLIRHVAARLLPADVAWDARKPDPARMNPFKAACREAMLEIGQELQSCETAPARAIYFDMPRLLADLTPDGAAGRKERLGKLWNTLSFLNYQ